MFLRYAFFSKSLFLYSLFFKFSIIVYFYCISYISKDFSGSTIHLYNTVEIKHAKIQWNLMAAGLKLYSLYLLFLLIDFLDEYQTINFKSTNKCRIYNKWYHTYHNLLGNLNQFIDKFIKKHFTVYLQIYFNLSILWLYFI